MKPNFTTAIIVDDRYPRKPSAYCILTGWTKRFKLCQIFIILEPMFHHVPEMFRLLNL